MTVTKENIKDYKFDTSGYIVLKDGVRSYNMETHIAIKKEEYEELLNYKFMYESCNK